MLSITLLSLSVLGAGHKAIDRMTGPGQWSEQKGDHSVKRSLEAGHAVPVGEYTHWCR